MNIQKSKLAAAVMTAVFILSDISASALPSKEWAQNGYRCEGSGSYHSLIPNGAAHYGLNTENLGRSSARELEKHLPADLFGRCGR